MITGSSDSRNHIIGKLHHLWLALVPCVCLVLAMALTGCKTLKVGSKNQEGTALKAVSDAQHILRLAPYKGADKSQFVFEICQINSPNDGCAIAFLSSIRKPVIFTIQQINQHRENAAEALAKFVQKNPELVGAVGSAAAAPVTYKVGTKLATVETSLAMKAETLHMIESQGFTSFEEAQEVIAARKKILAEKFGLEVDRFEFWYDDTVRFKKPSKLKAFLDAQDTDNSHVFKQDFVDFIKRQYHSELAVNNVTAERMLNWTTLFDKNSYSPQYKPRINWGELVEKYRTKLRGRELLTSEKNYQSVIDDLIDPSLTDEFKKYNNLRQVAEDYKAGQRSTFQDAFEKPLKRFAVHNRGVNPYTTGRTGSTGSSAVIHIDQFMDHDIPYEFKKSKLLDDIVRLNFAIQDHLPNKAAFQAAKTQLDELGMTPGQALKKWGKNKRLVKRVSVFFVVLAGILAGTAGAKKIFGIGSGVDKEESIALQHPSLFEVEADTSPVDTVQGIVVQLGEYLNKSGVDIDYYCMPSGCQLLY